MEIDKSIMLNISFTKDELLEMIKNKISELYPEIRFDKYTLEDFELGGDNKIGAYLMFAKFAPYASASNTE